MLTRVEVLLATLREQVTELGANGGAPRPRERSALARQQLLEDIDTARSAVKHARRRVAGLRGRSAAERPRPARLAR